MVRTLDKPHILCVDDDTELLDTLETLIRRNFGDYRVTPAFSGADALREIMDLRRQGRDVALILTDQLLGDTTGTELLTRLQVYYPDAGRVILTGHAALESAIEGLRIHLDAYVEKPLDERELVKAITPILQRHQLRQQGARLRELAQELTSRTSRLLDITFEALDRPLQEFISDGGDSERAIGQIRRGRENILLLSELFRAQREGAQASFDYYNAVDLVEDARRPLEAPGGLAFMKGQTLSLVRRNDRVVLFGNRNLQRIILGRLLYNACRFSPTDSAVVVVVRGPGNKPSPERDVAPYPSEVTTWLRKGAAVMSVSNSGILMQDDYLRILRAMTTSGRPDPLSSLALVVSRELVEAMGGALIFDGTPGREGTTFHLALPTASV